MTWEKLSPDDTSYFIDAVQDDALIGIFDHEVCEVYAYPYSFYKDAHLVTLENMSIAPPFTLEYLKSGEEIVYLDGSPEPFKILNEKGCLNLTSDTLIDYIEFYCRYVNQRPHNILLLRNADTMPYQDTIYIDFHFDKNNFGEKDFRIEEDGAGGFKLYAPFVFAGKIDPGIARISANGDIDIQKTEER